MNFLKLVLLSTVVPVTVHAQDITTIAGTGTQGYNGDGGPASAAELHISRIAIDNEGNIYASQPMEHVIRRIDKVTGIITTVAGNGTPGFSGDSGPATTAQFDEPESIAVNADGDLFVFDNVRVRKISKTTGIVATIAGTGVQGFAGDGGDALQAEFSPAGNIAIDTAGNILINDVGNFRIRKIDAVTNIITTIAGDGTWGSSGDGGPALAAQLQELYTMHVDRHNNIFISMANNHQVRKIDAVTGIITTVAGNGPLGCAGDGNPAVGQAMAQINGICTDKQDNFYISDGMCNAIRKVDGVTNIINTIAGTLAWNSGGFSGDGGPAVNATFNMLNSIITDTCDNIYICDQDNNRIRKIIFNSNCGELATSSVNSGIYSITPNPATSSIQIRSNEQIKTINISNVTGRIVSRVSSGKELVEVDVSDLGTGVYFVNVNGAWRQKFVKE